MPILAMLPLTLMLLLDAFDDAVVNNANADANMLNDARHLAGAYVVLLLPPLLTMLTLLKHLMCVDACDDVMLKCVHMCLFVSIARLFMIFHVCVLVRACICSAGVSEL